MTNAAARPGDCLILTKPLGTGIITFAAQIGRAPGRRGGGGRAVDGRAQPAARRKLMIECGAHACTDVTGFGLIGPPGGDGRRQRVDVEIVWDDLPLLPGVLECLAEGIASGAVERNRESSGDCLVADDDVQPAMLDLCFDPQTSGGLLIAVAASAAGDFLGRLHAAGIAEAAAIGNVVAAGTGRVFCAATAGGSIPSCRRKGDSPIFADAKIGTVPPSNSKQQPLAAEADTMACCDPNHQSDQSVGAAAGGVTVAERKFQEFLQAAGAAGRSMRKPSRPSPSRCRCWPAASRA